MEAEDPLKDLADIHLPDPLSFWPPAPGWWLVALLALALLAYAALRYVRAWRERQRLQAALGELDAAYQRYQDAISQRQDPSAAGLSFLQDCNMLLKRVALLHYPVAAMYGQSWLRFLDKSGKTRQFTTGAGQVLGDTLYRASFDGDAARLHQLCTAWIRQAYTPPAETQPYATGAGSMSGEPGHMPYFLPEAQYAQDGGAGGGGSDGCGDGGGGGND
ncbi:MAG: DUF4381 domain-containing protein [Pseudomonadales bacterium]|jgi:hypothetical protein|nr:DUF4381 domain-containing protein [Pseudomonadales bacterium]